MNLSPQERRALRKRYAPVKTIVKWVVIQNGIVLFENVSPSLVHWWLNNSGLKNAKKKPVYDRS